MIGTTLIIHLCCTRDCGVFMSLRGREKNIRSNASVVIVFLYARATHLSCRWIPGSGLPMIAARVCDTVVKKKKKNRYRAQSRSGGARELVAAKKTIVAFRYIRAVSGQHVFQPRFPRPIVGDRFGATPREPVCGISTLRPPVYKRVLYSCTYIINIVSIRTLHGVTCTARQRKVNDRPSGRYLSIVKKKKKFKSNEKTEFSSYPCGLSSSAPVRRNPLNDS